MAEFRSSGTRELRDIDPEILRQLRQPGVNPLDFDLELANFKRADLRGVNLAGANLRGANFWHAHLEGAHLEGAHLENSFLSPAFLQGAHLEGAFLNHANLKGVHLEGAHLNDADLTDADLTDADLTDADLTDAYFRGAKLIRTTLTGVRDADFTGAIFEEIQTKEDRKKMREEIDESMTAKKAKEEEYFDINKKGIDIMSGDGDTPQTLIKDFLNENPNNSVVLNHMSERGDGIIISTIYLFDRDTFIQLLGSSIVYPCREANGRPGGNNVNTKLPFANFASIIGRRLNIRKSIIDDYLKSHQNQNIFVNLIKSKRTYPSIASHDVMFNPNPNYVGALHCSAAEPEEEWYWKPVVVTTSGGSKRRRRKTMKRRKSMKRRRTRKRRKTMKRRK
jgi:uncharacterized protein YjbI with pentapeptide repeats